MGRQMFARRPRPSLPELHPLSSAACGGHRALPGDLLQLASGPRHPWLIPEPPRHPLEKLGLSGNSLSRMVPGPSGTLLEGVAGTLQPPASSSGPLRQPCCRARRSSGARSARPEAVPGAGRAAELQQTVQWTGMQWSPTALPLPRSWCRAPEGLPGGAAGRGRLETQLRPQASRWAPAACRKRREFPSNCVVPSPSSGQAWPGSDVRSLRTRQALRVESREAGPSRSSPSPQRAPLHAAAAFLLVSAAGLAD